MTTLQNSTALGTGSRHVGRWLPSPSALWELRGNSVGDLISQMFSDWIDEFGVNDTERASGMSVSRSFVHPTSSSRGPSSETASESQRTAAEPDNSSWHGANLLSARLRPALRGTQVYATDWPPTHPLTLSDIVGQWPEWRQTIDDGVSLALGDLRDSVTEAREEGFPIPSTAAFGNAERLVKAMYEISPRRFEVYPTPDGEIAIDAPDGRGSSVILLCDSEGGALCMAHLKGSHRSRRYSTTDALPDDFLREVLTELERESN